MTPDRRGQEPERTPDLITHDDRPVWVGERTDGELPVVVGDEVWTVPVDGVDPGAFPCGGPLPVLDMIDMGQVYLCEGEPHAGAVVTPTVVVELIPRDGRWYLQGFASSDASLPPVSEEPLWERDGIDASEHEEVDA